MSQTKGPDLYWRLKHLVETMPDLSAALTNDTRLWLAQVRAAIAETGDLTLGVQFGAALSMFEGGGAAARTQIGTITQSLYNALAQEARNLPPTSQGAFIPVGSTFDAVVALGKVLTTAKRGVMFVDPYADVVTFERYALLAPEGVPIEVLADSFNTKASLKAGAHAWVKQYGATRPLVTRLSPARALHDRLIILDGAEVYNIGQSLKDLADRSPTSINRLDPDTGKLKIEAHRAIWDSSTDIG